MNWFNFSNHLIKWLYLILKLTGIWWLFNIPYVFLGIILLMAPDTGTIHTMFLAGAVLLPFVAIPATVATLAIVRRYGRDDHSFSFLKAFWKYYRREYVKSMILGGINTTVLIIFYLALRYYADMSSFLAVVFYSLVIVTPFFFLLVYSFLVDQALPIKAYLTNTVFLFLVHPFNTLLMILDVSVPALLLWMVLPPLLLIIFPGFAALIVTHFFQKSMSKEIKRQQTSA